MYNSMISTADRTTHLKIVAVSLVASIVVLLVGMTARNAVVTDTSSRIQIAGPAGKPMAMSHSDTTVIR